VSSNKAAGGNGGSKYSDGLLVSAVNGNGLGGGIFAKSVSIDVINSTIAGNIAVSGNVGTGIGGGIYSASDAFRILNTILAGNLGTTNLNGINASVTSDAYGLLSSQGHNLIVSTNGASGFVASDLLNVDAKLGLLQDNGGPTFTHALLSGSAAIDAGASNGAPSVDQRGFPRPAVLGFDIGAYEFGSASQSISTFRECLQ